jgi:hypothetical protein
VEFILLHSVSAAAFEHFVIAKAIARCPILNRVQV